MTPNAEEPEGPTPESDFRRLGRWLLVVGTVAAAIAALVVLAVLFGGPGAVSESAHA